MNQMSMNRPRHTKRIMRRRTRALINAGLMWAAAVLEQGGELDGWDLAWAEELEAKRQARQQRELAEEARQAARRRLAEAPNTNPWICG